MFNVTFQDHAFEKANQQGPGHLEKKERLVVWEAARLDDLPRFTGVKELVLYGSTLTSEDLRQIAALPVLTSLEISKCSLPSLQVLGELTSLTKLELENLTLADPILPALSPCLESVKIHSCGITSIECLRGLSAVTKLDLSDNQIEDISPLEEFHLLKKLSIRNNRVRSLKPLRAFHALSDFGASHNQIDSVEPLRELTALNTLVLDGNRIADISALGALSALSILSMNGNLIRDIAPLCSLKALTSLSLDNNQIADISALASLTALTSVSLRNNRIRNLSPLCALPDLCHIDLRGNAIRDVTPLANLPRIVNPDPYSYSSYRIEVSAVADKKTLLEKPLYGLFEECLDYPELEPEKARRERLRKTNPKTSYVANVHPRVHFCRNAMLLSLKGGAHRIRVRNVSPSYRSNSHFPLYLDDKLLADVYIPHYLEDGSVETGCGEGVLDDPAVHEALNQSFTGLKHMAPALHPLLSLLESGLYLIADFDLFPMHDPHRDTLVHFWDAPEYCEEIHFDRYFDYSGGFGNAYDAPLYLFPTRRAGAMEADLVRRYEARLEEGDAFPRCVSLFLNGCVSLLLDGHHKAAAAAAQGKPVKTMVIFRVKDEAAVTKALERGERLYLMHRDKMDMESGPLLIKNGAGELLSPVCCLKDEKKYRLYIGPHGGDFGPWGSVPEEFKQRLGECLSNDTLHYGTKLPVDGIRAMIEELKDIHTLPERLEDEDERWWLERCVDWYRGKDHALDKLVRYLKMHPDSKWITDEEKQWIEELRANKTFSNMSDAFQKQWIQLMRSRMQQRDFP